MQLLYLTFRLFEIRHLSFFMANIYKGTKRENNDEMNWIPLEPLCIWAIYLPFNESELNVNKNKIPITIYFVVVVVFGK